MGRGVAECGSGSSRVGAWRSSRSVGRGVAELGAWNSRVWAWSSRVWGVCVAECGAWL